jgi:hypothetical protein
LPDWNHSVGSLCEDLRKAIVCKLDQFVPTGPVKAAQDACVLQAGDEWYESCLQNGALEGLQKSLPAASFMNATPPLFQLLRTQTKEHMGAWTTQVGSAMYYVPHMASCMQHEHAFTPVTHAYMVSLMQHMLHIMSYMQCPAHGLTRASCPAAGLTHATWLCSCNTCCTGLTHATHAALVSLLQHVLHMVLLLLCILHMTSLLQCILYMALPMPYALRLALLM